MVNKISKKELRKNSRDDSIKEGIFWSIKVAFGEKYISPFAIAINTSNSLVAMLSSISGLAGPISQIIGSRMIEKNSRKKILVRALTLETLMLLALISIGILFYKGIITTFLPILLVFTFGLYIFFGNLGHPAWFSWMGDIINENKRGRYFSKRNLILGFVSIIFALIAAFFLDYTQKNNLTIIGFIILFSLTLVVQVFRIKTIKNQYEPEFKLKKGYYFSFLEFIKKAPQNNFGRFSIYRFLIAFASTTSSALIAVYLLRYLNFSYLEYIIIILANSAFAILMINLWGKIADKHGNYFVLAITSIAIPLIPFLWILNPSIIYLILVPQLIGGISWAGFYLATGNIIYDNVSQQKRGLAVSYYNLMLGAGIFLGASLGAILIKILPSNIVPSIITIFVLSGLLRMSVVFWWLPKIKEIRKKEKFGKRELKNIIFKQARPMLFEEFHEIIHIKDYFTKKQ